MTTADLWNQYDRLIGYISTTEYVERGENVGGYLAEQRKLADALREKLIAPAEPQTPPVPSVAPQTTEERKYSACRICGRGPTTMGQHVAIATHGVHTDANGKPNQPNKGTAYCDHCEDETLVIQPAATVSSDASPVVEWLCPCGAKNRKDGFRTCPQCQAAYTSRVAEPSVVLKIDLFAKEAEARQLFKAGYSAGQDSVDKFGNTLDETPDEAFAAYRQQQEGRGK
ncbi:MAG: hypothetical protein ACKVQA_07025 [Burkholderiales bacterium]